MTVVEDVADDEREICARATPSATASRRSSARSSASRSSDLHEDAEKARQQDKEFGDLLKLKQARSQLRPHRGADRQAGASSSASATPSATSSSTSTRTARASSSRGIVRRFEKGNNIIVDLGRTEGVLPFREQTPRETYRPGDRIVAYVKDIDREARGPQIILSRTDVGPRREAVRDARCPRSTRASCASSPRAREPGARSQDRRHAAATRTSIRSARASA